MNKNKSGASYGAQQKPVKTTSTNYSTSSSTYKTQSTITKTEIVTTKQTNGSAYKSTNMATDSARIRSSSSTSSMRNTLSPATATDATRIRSVSTSVTSPMNKKTLPATYTPVYSSLRKPIVNYKSTETPSTSINKPLRNAETYGILNTVFGSAKPSEKGIQDYKTTSMSNTSPGLFYTFPNQSSNNQVKQTVLLPPMVATSAVSAPTNSVNLKIDRTTLPPARMVYEKPEKKSFFANPFSSSKRGYALILNHYKYQNDYQPKREGTQYDVEKLKTVFGAFRIETDVAIDLRLAEIRSLVNRLKYKDFSKYKCFVIVILTHGNRNDILCASDNKYNFITEIEDPLLLENKTLLEKPKIFIVQACRGSDEMPTIETDSVRIGSSMRQSTVAKRNIFKCNATYEGYVSFRNTKKGTIFIQTFCKQLEDIGSTATIYEVMTKVIGIVSNDPEIPQVPTVVSSMTESFCFGKMLK